jgi:hypothetical protein
MDGFTKWQAVFTRYVDGFKTVAVKNLKISS